MLQASLIGDRALLLITFPFGKMLKTRDRTYFVESAGKFSRTQMEYNYNKSSVRQQKRENM